VNDSLIKDLRFERFFGRFADTCSGLLNSLNIKQFVRQMPNK